MRGWSGQDIAERYGVTKQAVSAHFIRAVKNIITANAKRWKMVYCGGNKS